MYDICSSNCYQIIPGMGPTGPIGPAGFSGTGGFLIMLISMH